MKIIFIAGAEGSFKEKVLLEYVHNLRTSYPDKTVFVNDKNNASELQNYGLKPVWGQMERVAKVITNSQGIDNVIIMGWHIPELLTELEVAYPNAEFILVRGHGGKVDNTAFDTVVETVTKQDVDTIIAAQTKSINDFVTEHNLSWTQVSEITPIFVEDRIESDTKGDIDIIVYSK